MKERGGSILHEKHNITTLFNDRYVPEHPADRYSDGGMQDVDPGDPAHQHKQFGAAEQVVREYFTYWNEKSVTELEKRMTPDRKGITWEFDKPEHVKLLGVNEIGSSEENTGVFDILFDIKFKNGDGGGSGLGDGKLTWSYLLKSDGENSSRLIHDWGVGERG
ncbi:MAG: hypothetical protein NT102_05305 [Caldiserica bacterium]|nr:hypothetical protein [Caldisericota bacterium]